MVAPTQASITFTNILLPAKVPTEESLCSICREDIYTTDGPYAGHTIESQNSLVAHIFHQTCITAWFTAGRPICPLCRVPVSNVPIDAAAAHLAAVQAEENRGLAVIQAATDGLLAEIQALLADGAQIQELHRGEALIAAIYNGGHLGIIRELLANGAQIPEEDRGLAVYAAVGNNRPDIVRKLLANGAQISEGHRGNAVLLAVHNNRPDIVRELLANGAQISEDHRGMAVVYAVRHNHPAVLPAVLRELLANGAQISAENRSLAIQEAIRLRDQEIVNLLQPHYCRQTALTCAKCALPIITAMALTYLAKSNFS